MGKSEIDRLRPSQLSLQIGHRNNSPITLFEPKSNDDDDGESNGREITVPEEEMGVFDNQVGGHTNDGKNYSMLKYKGFVLKPIVKKVNGERESNFYRQLQTTSDAMLKLMGDFVPKYYGLETIKIDDKAIDCLVLEDLTKGYKEPCIMDIKIGKRTWDPLATYKKIVSEDSKYHDSKIEFGFCIPGFQVYDVNTGKVTKFGKDYGLQLNKDGVIEALKIFLNADSGFNRILLVQLLVNLWRIQEWARKQRSIHLYSSSILLIYDARRLRHELEESAPPPPEPKPQPQPKMRRKSSLYRPLSLAKLDCEDIHAGFSGQLDEDGPIFENTTPSRRESTVTTPVIRERQKTPEATNGLKRVHSFHNNFDKDLQNIKSCYTETLDDLVDDERHELWATAKIVDLAHAFPSEKCTIDQNYLQGVESLVGILEDFLSELYTQNC